MSDTGGDDRFSTPPSPGYDPAGTATPPSGAGDPQAYPQPEQYPPADWNQPPHATGSPDPYLQQYQQRTQPYAAGRTSALAVASLVTGILSLPAIVTLIGGPLLGIAAIVLGILALKQVRTTGEQGRGMAIGGIVTGALGLLLPILFALLLFAFASDITTLLPGEGGTFTYESVD